MTIQKSITFCLVVMLWCLSCKDQKATPSAQQEISPFVTPAGKKVYPSTPSQKTLEQYEKAKQDFLKDPDNADHSIWYGRRTAYLGHYEEAIAIYSEGIEKHPDDPRLYRHRGHRYISLRKFDKAIADLERAAQLIEGKEDKTEPDGMPNALNIPVSTLHSNIWYHLGLAYYLKNDMEKAYQAYLKCRNLKSNNDNLVSGTHWLYMIQRRMGNDTLATKLLEPVHDTMTIIENFSYYKLCKFYKGMIPVDSLQTTASSPADDAVKYGLANWYFYNGNVEKARVLMAEILEGTSWSSFGYIAAERDYLNAFNK